jgi:hypothetical protein
MKFYNRVPVLSRALACLSIPEKQEYEMRNCLPHSLDSGGGRGMRLLEKYEILFSTESHSDAI